MQELEEMRKRLMNDQVESIEHVSGQPPYFVFTFKDGSELCLAAMRDVEIAKVRMLQENSLEAKPPIPQPAPPTDREIFRQKLDALDWAADKLSGVSEWAHRALSGPCGDEEK